MHVWLFVAQCEMPAGFIDTTHAEEMQSYKMITIF